MEDEPTPPPSVVIHGLFRATVRKALVEVFSGSPGALIMRDQIQKDLLALTESADIPMQIELSETDLLKIARGLILDMAK